ncbi:hypothetical protein Nepgr_000460 [Nepenthes gracilis]|uniref:Uncharacterized protein n=1 Tax=Nepenthes gracilis TaxID=150966 RepID=A0AAD3P363_NEPGR|nr:hypothetical protein Nepgr_000460 [Nepenthes gracilis]
MYSELCARRLNYADRQPMKINLFPKPKRLGRRKIVVALQLPLLHSLHFISHLSGLLEVVVYSIVLVYRRVNDGKLLSFFR